MGVGNIWMDEILGLGLVRWNLRLKAEMRNSSDWFLFLSSVHLWIGKELPEKFNLKLT